MRRNPAVAGLTAAVMVLLVVGTTVATGLALWATGEAQKAREEATRADRERDTARDQAYRADTFSHSNLLELAVRALVDDGDMQRAAELLRRCPEGMRTTWEHRSVQGLYHRLASPLTLKGDTSELSGMAFSPDGSRIATAIARHDPKTKKWQGEVKVWDAQTGQPKLNLVGPIGPCRDLAFSPDGTRIVAHNTGDFGNTHEVKVWDVRTGRQLHSLAGALGPVAFSPDGKRLASSSPDNWLKGWDIETGKEDLWFLSGHTKGVGHIAYSPDGKRLASVSSDATLKVWDPQTGRELHSLTGASGPLAFSPDGKRLASSSPVNWVKVWDTETGRELRVFKGHSDPVGTLAFNYDGSRLASGGHDKSVRVWACENAGPFPETLTLWGHTGPVTAVWYSPDRKRLVSGGGTVKAWDAWTGRAVPMVKWAPWGSGREARSPDGTRAASWDGNTVRLWNLGEDLELSTFTRQVGSEATSLAFSPDGMQVASGYPLRVWGLRTGREMLFQREGDRVCAVAYSPDGTRIASGDAGGGLVVWDARNGQRKLAWGGHNNIVTSVAYSPDGTRIASGSGVFDGNHFIAGEVKVWDALTGQLKHTLKGHVGLVNDLAYSPDGAHIAATERSSSHRGELNVWGSASGQKVFTLNNQVGAFHGLAYSPDGTRIASGRAVWDKAQYKYISCEVKVYDAVTGEEKQALRGHTGRVLSVAYSPDGTRIASGGEDRVIKIWDARTGHEKLTLEGHVQPVTKVAFSPDGRLLASADRDGTVKLWDAP